MHIKTPTKAKVYSYLLPSALCNWSGNCNPSCSWNAFWPPYNFGIPDVWQKPILLLFLGIFVIEFSENVNKYELLPTPMIRLL